ncbi:hypothetical protein [Ferrimonas pelagia]|uniref:Mechanosensitive ion channel n=1 Tax=Ferrimonas pelagia TaxID=1177826 RepID=A0ABP9EMF0_9GAMM
MTWDHLYPLIEQANAAVIEADTYIQIAIILSSYVLAYFIARRIRKLAPALDPKVQAGPALHWRRFWVKLSGLLFPVIAIFLLRLSLELTETTVAQGWLVHTALTVAVLIFVNSLIQNFINSWVAARIFRWIGLPILFLHLIDWLDGLIAILDSISIGLGNVEISVYGIARILIFGSLLFWLGRISSKTGRQLIAHRQELDARTRELASKLLEITIFFVISLLLLKILGVNLTALAVFGGFWRCLGGRDRPWASGDCLQLYLRDHHPDRSLRRHRGLCRT